MKVSFDFDDTLQTAMDNPNEEIVAKFKEHMRSGDEIIIVTSRNESHGSKKEIKDFLIRHGLKVQSINFTNGDLKASFLDANDVELHYDDDDEELKAIKGFPDITGVNAYTDQAEADFKEYWDLD